MCAIETVAGLDDVEVDGKSTALRTWNTNRGISLVHIPTQHSMFRLAQSKDIEHLAVATRLLEIEGVAMQTPNVQTE